MLPSDFFSIHLNHI